MLLRENKKLREEDNLKVKLNGTWSARGYKRQKATSSSCSCVTYGNAGRQPEEESSFPVLPMSPALPESWAGLEVGIGLFCGQLWQQCRCCPFFWHCCKICRQTGLHFSVFLNFQNSLLYQDAQLGIS